MSTGSWLAYTTTKPITKRKIGKRPTKGLSGRPWEKNGHILTKNVCLPHLCDNLRTDQGEYNITTLIRHKRGYPSKGKQSTWAMPHRDIHVLPELPNEDVGWLSWVPLVRVHPGSIMPMYSLTTLVCCVLMVVLCWELSQHMPSYTIQTQKLVIVSRPELWNCPLTHINENISVSFYRPNFTWSYNEIPGQTVGTICFASPPKIGSWPEGPCMSYRWWSWSSIGGSSQPLLGWGLEHTEGEKHGPRFMLT
jgi:hypothetical protein